MKIELSPDLKLPLDATTETFAVLARKDGGKTYTGLKLFEQMHAAGAQCVSIDPVGKWWALRLAADGKSPGIDLPVFGGLLADLPLEPTAGALIARVIVERRISAVIDVSLFEDRDMKRFVTDFARELYKLKQREQSVLHLFVEEASTFMPQDKEDGNDPPMLNAFKKIVRKGRNYGIGCTLIDQRAQDVNKKVLNQTSILIVLGTSGTSDRAAIEKWVRDKHIDTSGLDELASLEQGDAFVWVPRAKTFQRVHIGARWTFDASATPKLGGRRVVRKLTPTDVSQLRDAIGESVERAKASDPALLRAEVARLRAELAKGAKIAPAPAPAVPPKRVEVPVFKDGEVKRIDAAVGKFDAAIGKLGELVQKLVGLGGDVQGPLDDLVASLALRVHESQAEGVDVHRAVAAGRAAAAPKPAPEKRIAHLAAIGRAAPEGLDGRLPGITRPQQRVLDALAWFCAFGIEHPSRNALAAVCRVKASTGTFRNNLGALRTAGLIDYPLDNHVVLTSSGAAAAMAPDIPATNEAMQQAVMEVTTKPQAALLRVVIAAYPNAVSRAAIGIDLGVEPTTGTFRNNLGALRTLGALDYPADGMVVATSMLFPLPVAA